MSNEEPSLNEQETAQGAAPDDTSQKADEGSEERGDTKRTRPRRSKSKLELQRKEARIAELEAQLAQASSSQPSKETNSRPKKPVQDDYDDISEFEKDLASWNHKNTVMEAEQAAEKKFKAMMEQHQEQQTRDQNYRHASERFNYDLSRLEGEQDFTKIRANLRGDADNQGITQGVYNAISRQPNGLAILAHIGRNPEMIDDLVDASDKGELELGAEVGRLSGSVSSNRRRSNAPRPAGSFASSADEGGNTQKMEAAVTAINEHPNILTDADWAKMGLGPAISQE